MASSPHIKAVRQPKLPTKQIKIPAPPTEAKQAQTMAEKQIAAFMKNYQQQVKNVAAEQKAFGLHTVAEKTATPTSGASKGSTTAPYRRYP